MMDENRLKTVMEQSDEFIFSRVLKFGAKCRRAGSFGLKACLAGVCILVSGTITVLVALWKGIRHGSEYDRDKELLRRLK